MSVDLAAIAKKVVNECLRVKPGEYFWITCGDECYFKFCEEVAIQAIESGAHPFISISSDRLLKTYLEQSVEYLEAPAKFSFALTKFIDVGLDVVFPRDPESLANADPDKLAAMFEAGKPVREKLYERNKDRVAIRKASLLYPTPEGAKKYGISYEELADMVWGAINIDYDALKERAKKIASAMRNADKVFISSAEGTDLSFSIKDRPPFIDDGVFDEEDMKENVYLMNLPSGEVCIAPIEDSANGIAIFQNNRFMGRDLKNIRIEFRNGRISSLDGEEGADYYKSVIEKQTGDKDQIAELGIGLNPRITKVLGELALDEKIIGTIHIATGENRMLHGAGSSSFHWDLVMERPTVKIGDTLIMDNGEFLI